VMVQRGWSRHRRVSSAIEESDLYLYFLLLLATFCRYIILPL